MVRCSRLVLAACLAVAAAKDPPAWKLKARAEAAARRAEKAASSETPAPEEAAAAAADAPPTDAEPPARAAPVSLTVSGVGSLRVDPGVEPAFVVETFAQRARAGGVVITAEDMQILMDALCARPETACGRPLAPTLTVNVDGVGTVVLEPWTEPGAGVLELARRAAAAGRPLPDDVLASVHAKVCAVRPCAQPLASRLAANVSDVGVLVVEAWDDVADRAETKGFKIRAT